MFMLGGALVSLGIACGNNNPPVQASPISTVAATSPKEVPTRVPNPTPIPAVTVEPTDESERLALVSFSATFRDLKRTRQSILNEFETVGVELQVAEFDQVFAVLENVIKRQEDLIREAEGIASWTNDTSRLKKNLRFALSEELVGYETLLRVAKRAQSQDPTGNPAELIKNLTGMHGEAKRRLSTAEAYVLRVQVLIYELHQGHISAP